MSAIIVPRRCGVTRRRRFTTSAPAFQGKTADWDVASITPQTDNTDLTSWPESVQGLNVTNIDLNPPKYRTSLGPSGGPAVFFNGTAHRLARTGVAVSDLLTVESDPALAEGSVYAVLHRVSSGSVFPTIFRHESSALRLRNASGNLLFACGNQTTGQGQISVANPAGFIDAWAVLACVRRGTTGKLFLNGDEVLDATFSTVGIPSGTNRLTLGSAGNVANNSMNGYLARLVVCDTGHSDTAAIINSQALMSEYGISA